MASCRLPRTLSSNYVGQQSAVCYTRFRSFDYHAHQFKVIHFSYSSETCREITAMRGGGRVERGGGGFSALDFVASIFRDASSRSVSGSSGCCIYLIQANPKKQGQMLPKRLTRLPSQAKRRHNSKYSLFNYQAYRSMLDLVLSPVLLRLRIYYIK